MVAKKKGEFFSESIQQVYSCEFFHHRVREEKQRTDRFGCPFSLLIIDFHHMLSNGNGSLKAMNGKITKVICNAVMKSSRDTDIKGWYDSDRLALLLVNTDSSGAQIALKRFRSNLELNLSKFLRLSDIGQDKILLTTSTYPNQPVGVELECKQKELNFPQECSSKGKITQYLDDNAYYNKNGTNSTKWKLGLFTFKPGHDILLLSPVLAPLAISDWKQDSIFKEIKRCMDFIGALFGIAISSPVMLIVAMIIKATSPGPVFFRQERVGYLGNRFNVLKFRSMYHNVDSKAHQEFVTDFITGKLQEKTTGEENRVYKMTYDSRITPIGKFIRKTSIDEIPQLFNVLKGDLSLVGPRPPIPYEVEKYKLWHRKRISEVKPGITGLWQVSGRSLTTFEDMVRLDLCYVNNWSLMMDLKILMKTIKAVCMTKGAY